MREHHYHPCAARRGFTLVELLTVIAIIALLTAVLFPVFSSARAKGRDATCLSNLHQIGLALRAYGTDYGEKLPLANNKPSEDGPPGLPQVLSSYVRNSKIFRCPSDYDGYWQAEGTSYDYALGMLNVGIGLRPWRLDMPPWPGVELSKVPIMSDFSDKWHAGGTHCLYLDGHVK